MRRTVDKTTGVAALVLSGLAAYVFLAVAARSLGAAGFVPLGALWSLVFLATAAAAAPLETELARRVGSARGAGRQYADDVRAGFKLALIGGAGAVVLALIAGPVVDRQLFASHAGFTVLAALAFAGLAMGGAAKGVSAGAGRLALWGAYLLADGGIRCLLGILAAVFWPTPTAFAIALTVGPWLALLVPAPMLRRMLTTASPRPVAARASTLAGTTSPLVVAAIASSVLSYLGAVMLPALVPTPNPQVGAYVAALSLARLPLFAFSPLIAVAVPRIAYAVARRDGSARRLAMAFVGVALLGGVASVGVGWAAGSGLLLALFGVGFSLPAASLAAIATAAGAWLLATASAAVAVAAGRARFAAIGWCIGVAVAILAALLPSANQFYRTDLTIASGGLVASVATTAGAAIAIRSSSRVRVLTQ